MKVLSENNQPKALSAPVPLAAGLWQSRRRAGLSRLLGWMPGSKSPSAGHPKVPTEQMLSAS